MWKLSVFVALLWASLCLVVIDVHAHESTKLDPFTKIAGGYYYIDHNLRVNWFSAYEQCRLIGAELVTFETAAEFDAISEYLGKYDVFDFYWTSGNDLATTGVYHWFSSGLPITINRWSPGEPNNAGGKEHCVHLVYNNKTSTLNDRECNNDASSHSHFICEATWPTIGQDIVTGQFLSLIASQKASSGAWD